MHGARLAPALVPLLLLATTLTGGLGDPTPGGFVSFDDVRRDHFDAFAVHRAEGSGHDAPLRVYVHLIGDAPGADLRAVQEYLLREVNVVLVPSPSGVPLYLTRDDLIATSGTGALGATVRSGMVAEVHDGTIYGCVVAHEILHFLGLHHVDDRANLMYPRCAPGKLARATLDDWQRDEIHHLERITALTPTGLKTWANR